MNVTPRKQPDIREQRIGDEVYLSTADGKTMTVLNTVAMLIWSLCDGMHTAPDMLNILCELYPHIDPDTLDRDIQDCLREFRANGLLRATA